MSLHLSAGAFALALVPWVASALAPLTLERALELALSNNTDLKVASAGLGTLESQLEAALVASVFNPEVFGAVGPRFAPTETRFEFELGVSQTLEVFGQGDARRKAARAWLAESEADFLKLRAQVAFDTRVAFGAVLAAEREFALARKAESLAKEALDAAFARQAAGAAPRMEVNTARAEQGRAAREVLVSKVRVTTLRARLRLLLGLDASQPVAVDGALPEQAQSMPPLEILQAQAWAQRADYAAARATLVAARHEVTLADRLKGPSPTFGLGYAREEGEEHLVFGTFSIPIPFFDRNQAHRGDARADVEQAQLRLDSLKSRIRQEVAVAVDRLEAANETLALYQGGVLEALEENLEMSLEAYAAGKLDFLGLVLVRRQVLDGRADFIHVQQELNDARAELDRALGVMP